MYRELKAESDAEALIASSEPAWLFKHSNTCPTSSAALDEFSAYLAAHPHEPAGMLVVQIQRPLSNWLATRLKRTHQSPQLFLVKGGAIVWTASHWGITAAAMDQARKQA